MEALVPALDYAEWFTGFTGYAIDPERFGAYAIQPMGGTLYLGFGAGWPVVTDGAALAAFDGAGFRGVGQLDEQGVLELDVADGTLLVPGVDPCCPDDWSFGNFYTYRPEDGLVKWRNLPNVIHAWGTWYDAGAGTLYLAASSHLGDFESYTGEIWRSHNRGESWTRIANRNQEVGDFRTYDILGVGGRRYALRSDRRGCDLIVQETADGPWNTLLDGERLGCFYRLLLLGDWLIAPEFPAGTVHVVRPGAGPEVIPLPFELGPGAFNWGVVIGSTLYVAAADGRILATEDLRTWETVLTTGLDFSAIAHWASRNRLVFASAGSGAGVWTLTLCGDRHC